jgi:chromosome partitioning protein
MSCPPHIIVLANEKGGTGKSTLAVHLAVALESAGYRTQLLDLDPRQRSSDRYLENRRASAERLGVALPTPASRVLDPDIDPAPDLLGLAPVARVVLVDLPGRDSPLGRRMLSKADTLVTPINDSFLDFDLLGRVDAEDYAVTRPGFYAELVWKARQQRAREHARALDWVVVRNRLATLEARNRKRVGGALQELSRRVGFRVAPGLSERVIFRELFPSGLTLLDIDCLPETTMSHVAARAELRDLVAALRLPLAADTMPGREEAAAWA